jgi:hypothetical protein
MPRTGGRDLNGQRTPNRPKTKKRDAAAEKAYKDALKRIPEQKISDPWGTMR